MADEVVKKRILVVEDEEPMLQALYDVFTQNGFFVIKAKNGEEGLALALSEHPDLILLDILMPVMDGIALMHKLRADPWGKHAPIILLTNVNPDTNALIQAVVENQPAYYLIKSDVKLQDVVQKVKEVLSMK